MVIHGGIFENLTLFPSFSFTLERQVSFYCVRLRKVKYSFG